ncbi:uncharacterized protein LOC124941131 [Impatiens glandulifera]|uniref:uncharacterized protein LOC124941131 n=1 Tax=Impatiens glandulifera TaxID=253017 RepID=UPI001FB0EC65|nr:uncharacterized protein LOC124941131 [Impatiens glandulifera]
MKSDGENGIGSNINGDVQKDITKSDEDVLTIVVSNGELVNSLQGSSELPPSNLTVIVDSADEVVVSTNSPRKECLSSNASSCDECRVCQQEKEENLIDLGCQCRGGLARAHKSCITAWFQIRGSNMCEICQQVAANVPPPESQPHHTSYWVWRTDPGFRGSIIAQEQRGGVNALWVAFAILIGGLLLDVLISITLGVSALPVNIIIGVIVVLGLGTTIRLGLEYCQEWNARRVTRRVETTMHMGYHPAL